MDRFSSQWMLTPVFVLGFRAGTAYADGFEPEAVWPWLTLILATCLAITIVFCFWLQRQISRLQLRYHEKAVEADEAGKQRLELEAEDRMRTAFFHSSSHELRTPLNGIIGFLQLMFQGQYGPLPAHGQAQIKKCILLAESLKYQITTILDLADGRRGKLELQNSRIALNQLVSEVEAMAEAQRLRYPDCHFEMKKVWMNDDSSLIQDAPKLMMIIRHLVGNAFKFGKPQERNHVQLVLTKRNKALTVEISDQGLGMSPEQISRIFDPEPLMNEGMGLGLIMVRMLLRLMQGEMKVSSEPGVGSRFTVVIPEQSAVHRENPPSEFPSLTLHADAVDTRFAQVPAMPPSHNLMKMEGYAAHILVVDDNQINCEIIQEILIPQGYRVSLAYGGREALSRMRADRPDLVLLDLAMPEFSGEQVMQEKQLDNGLNEIPVILITARASEQDRIHGLDLGADDYLTKPIIQQELVLRVRNLLSRQRLTKRIALMEEREKLAQLGELITDLSREIREIWADHNGNEAGRKLCREVLAALPQADELGSAWAETFLHEHDSSEDIDLEALPLPKTDAATLTLLRGLRLQLAPAPLPTAEKTRLWRTLNAMGPSELLLLARVTSLAATHMHLMEQSHKSRLLMDGILEFHQRRGNQRFCRVDQTLARTATLLGPRLRLAGVRLSMDLPPLTVMIHPADLMQVGISLIAILCQRLEMLLDQDKWLNIATAVKEDQVLIRFTCGGPPLTEAQALRLFDPVAEGSEPSGHSGLHVARRIVLRAPGRLDFNLSESTTSFELELPKALLGIY